MKNEPFIMALCYRCKADFQSTGKNYIRYVKPYQFKKKLCDYCSVRYGYNFEIKPRENRGNRK